MSVLYNLGKREQTSQRRALRFHSEVLDQDCVLWNREDTKFETLHDEEYLVLISYIVPCAFVLHGEQICVFAVHLSLLI